jgi:hypothetical protein
VRWSPCQDRTQYRPAVDAGQGLGAGSARQRIWPISLGIFGFFLLLAQILDAWLQYDLMDAVKRSGRQQRHHLA